MVRGMCFQEMFKGSQPHLDPFGIVQPVYGQDEFFFSTLQLLIYKVLCKS